MMKAGIVGGTGYTGVELLRLLAQHPQVELRAITSRKEAGTPVAAMFPSLRGRVDLAFTAPDASTLRGCDVVFFATPHGVAMQEARALLDAGAKVIDLSADFRMQDLAEWERWYKHKHTAPELVREAVYGLCEINREKIRKARLVANPGCYPTAVQLGFLPLLEAGVIDPLHLIADAKSGVSGAGRKAELSLLFRGLGQLQRLQRRRPPPSAGDPREPGRGDQARRRPGLYAASLADHSRHLRHLLRPDHEGSRFPEPVRETLCERAVRRRDAGG
jgi:N-acetyl-gamma-glutamyl-phosphate reductase